MITENTGRSCRFHSIFTVTDFDITEESMAPFEKEFLEKAARLQARVYRGELAKVETGIYGTEVRVWGVHRNQ